MSSILKALKKLEKDNAARKPGQQKIDSNILLEQQSSGISKKSVILLLVLFVAVGSGSTYLLMKKQLSTSNPSQTSIPTQAMHAPEVAPATSLKQKNPEAPPVTRNTVPNQNQASINKRENDTKPFPRSITSPVISSQQTPSQQTPALPEKQVSVPQIFESTVVAPPAAKPVQSNVRPKLIVNGIAYQEGSKDNLAVVNGNPVSKGSVIEGVMVEEVLGDRVRFSKNGDKFEIILNKSNR